MEQDAGVNMNVFHEINETIDKPDYTITIKNVYASQYHWGSDKNIVRGLSSIEEMLYSEDDINQSLLSFAIAISKNNERVEELTIYNVPEENRTIFLVQTDVRTFKDIPLFEREMTITFKKKSFVFSLIELPKAEHKKMVDEKVPVPANWVLNEKMTRRFKLLLDYAE